MFTGNRFVLRRALASIGKSTNGGAKTLNPTTAMIAKAASPRVYSQTIQCFGTPAKKIAEASSSSVPVGDDHKYENLVEESIKKLITTSHRDDAIEEQLKPISNEDIEVRLRYFQKVFEEAELCLSDLRETLFEVDDEQYREECNCAEGALDNAFTAYIDLLEDFRRASEEQIHSYSEERSTNAGNLKRLRKELDQIIAVANNRDNASR